MFHNYPDAFKQQILRNSFEVARFWSGIQEHGSVEGLQGEDLQYAVPLALHGDEVPVTGVGKCWSKCALTFQYFSILAHAAGTPTIELLQWLWSTFDNLCIEGVDGTVFTFMKIMKFIL